MVGTPSRNLIHRAPQGRWPAEHFRIYSQSTAASSSPIDNVAGPKAAERVRKPIASKTKRVVRVEPGRKREINAVKPRNSIRNWEHSVKTPLVSTGKNRKGLNIFSSPGGCEYIVTPGKHKISVTEFISGIDAKQAQEGCPAVRALAHYQENMLRMWLEREKLINPNVYMLSFKEGTALEQFRQMALQSVFQYAVEHRLHEKTVHLTCFNVSRLIYSKFVEEKDAVLTHSLFGSIVVASLRHAIKNDESFDKSELFRIDPQHIWNSCCYLRDVVRDRSEASLNKLEVECLPILEDPANPPLSPEFLDRYLGVGGWPEYQLQYRELASYLIGLALFANTSNSPLKCVPHSQISAAALVLAIKVINTDNNTTKYEYWPMRLQQYTGLTMDDLKPVIRGLANLLRHKPRWSQILERYYGKWSEYDWN